MEYNGSKEMERYQKEGSEYLFDIIKTIISEKRKMKYHMKN